MFSRKQPSVAKNWKLKQREKCRMKHESNLTNSEQLDIDGKDIFIELQIYS